MDKIKEELLQYISGLNKREERDRLQNDICEINKGIVSINKALGILDIYGTDIKKMRLNERIRESREEDMVKSLVAILDSVGWLLDSAEVYSSGGLVKTIETTRKLIARELLNMKLRPTPEKGDLYNENYHVCIGYKKDATLINNQVVEVVKKGYILGNKLIRPAEVIVVNNNEGEEIDGHNRN